MSGTSEFQRGVARRTARLIGVFLVIWGLLIFSRVLGQAMNLRLIDYGGRAVYIGLWQGIYNDWLPALVLTYVVGFLHYRGEN